MSPGVEYIFTVSAENSAGEGPASNSLVAMTFPLGKGKHPKRRSSNVRGRSGGAGIGRNRKNWGGENEK